ncbi:CPBP family intramembrane metalloprotease [Romeria aff. gracilis LEGE 07310]|uniref:CPBP family intramembrane metalloprotease n=1 Tax=Vasconcelosia minhoensis LEGE 07310 TaxID=915328 RepID=A0A8J7ATD5_9CYAN|nr:CPBP family intramembrane glutamic endopeptidase [Romeria gracilis]MBE9080160.1 CPBP family intramembrane metalloprotease [Romeria aff. gracilis LEGE 07310]
MTQPFMQLARLGQNRWWRYLLGVPLILAIWYGGSILNGIGLYLVTELDNNPATRIVAQPFAIEGVPSYVTFAVLNLGFAFFLLGIFIAVRYLHRRPLRSLITPSQRVSWMRVLQGFTVFMVIQLTNVGLSYLLSPESFTLTYDPQEFFAFLLLALILTPLQTGTEELFFRGYLLQGLGLKLKTGVAIALTSLIFMAFHLSNPEVLTQVSAVGKGSLVAYYFMFGLFLAWLSLTCSPP